MTKGSLWPALVAALVWTTSGGAQQPADTALRRQQRALDSLAAVTRALEARLDSVMAQRSTPATGDELAAIRAAAEAAASDSTAAQPQQARLGQNALNPEISVTGDLRTYV